MQELYGVETTKTRRQEILDGLNEQQKLPVLDYKGASILIAGAGSGKSHVVVSRAAYMIEDGVRPENILIFTFTRKAANELKERVSAYVGARSQAITISTYHSFCMRILRIYSDYIGWSRNFSIYDTDDSSAVLSEIIDDSNIKTAIVAKAISSWKEKMMNPQAAMAQAQSDLEKKFANYYQVYNMYLKAQNAFDFDDLIYYVIRLFESHPEIKQLINSKYTYITADEAQDSSKRDLELIYHLGGEQMNVCLTGDDWQSIYAFRGSDINAVFDFVNRFSLKKFYLERNYRSTKVIVAASKSVIRFNEGQFDKDVYSERTSGDKILYSVLHSPQAEAERVVSHIKTLVRGKYSYKDIAILYRMSSLSRVIEDAFLKNNIPYKMLSGTPFYERMEIKDVLSYLRVIVNPCDIIAFKRSLLVPKRGIGDKSLERLFSCNTLIDSDIITLKTLIDACKDVQLKGKAKQGVLQYAAILEHLYDLSKLATPKEMIEAVINSTKYQTFLSQLPKEEYEDRMNNLLELESMAEESVDLVDFINNMSINNIEQEKDDDPDRVNMMTIHGSKGLEFPIVFLVGANEGVLPHFRSISEGNVSEERRLFYVAMTRAENFFSITRSSVTMMNGIPRQTEPSRFIKEIDPRCIYKS